MSIATLTLETSCKYLAQINHQAIANHGGSVRRKPNGKSEVVLIDHGLYVDMGEEMRKNYCTTPRHFTFKTFTDGC